MSYALRADFTSVEFIPQDGTYCLALRPVLKSFESDKLFDLD